MQSIYFDLQNRAKDIIIFYIVDTGNMAYVPADLKDVSHMYDQILLPTDGDACIKLIYACQILTKQYRSVLEEVGTAYHVSENELRVLVCLSVYPEVHTQKDLQATGLPLSISSICRMTDALRKKGYLTTTLDPHDRRSWIIHLEERGSALAHTFQEALHQRMETVFQRIPGFDRQDFVGTLVQIAEEVQCLEQEI